MLGSRLIKAYRYSYLRYLYWLSFGEDILSIRVPINVWIFLVESYHRSPSDSGQIETKESAPRVVKDSKQAIYNTIYLKVLPGQRERNLYAQALTGFRYRKSTLYLKVLSQGERSSRIFAVPSMFEKRKADAVFPPTHPKCRKIILFIRKLPRSSYSSGSSYQSTLKWQERPFHIKKVMSTLE